MAKHRQPANQRLWDCRILWRRSNRSGGIFTDNGGPLTTIVSGLGPLPVGSPSVAYGNPSIANNGNVAFVVSDNTFFGGVPASGIYTGNGGPLTTINFSNSSVVDPVIPAISKDGSNVVFEQPGTYSAYSANGGHTTLLGTAGPFDPIAQVGVNNSGTALVVLDASNEIPATILTEVGTTLTTVADAGSYWHTFGEASLNDAGQIAFTADPQPGVGVPGLFITDGSAFDRLVSIGDPLDGSTIAAISIGPEGLNDLGQIAFLATLANGQEGIFVAGPTSGVSQVPEPTALALLAIAAAALFAVRRDRA